MKKLLMHFFIAIPKKKETEEKKEPLNAIKKRTFVKDVKAMMMKMNIQQTFQLFRQ